MYEISSNSLAHPLDGLCYAMKGVLEAERVAALPNTTSNCEI